MQILQLLDESNQLIHMLILGCPAGAEADSGVISVHIFPDTVGELAVKLGVMFYPTTVFVGTIGINIQTMFCHGTMITLGVYLLYSGYVKLEHKTILKALPVFLAAVAMAMVMNEIAYQSGLLATDEFNMFFISPYCEPSLALFSLIQPLVPFAVSIVIYVAGFTLAAYLILLAAMGIAKLAARKKPALTV